ncbi:MAG: Arm DNA-binding domain-containing protein [Roseinatronobacter sp.]
MTSRKPKFIRVLAMLVVRCCSVPSDRMPPVWGHLRGFASDAEKRCPQMPLTDTQIRSLKPKDKPYKVSDFQGLYVTVAPSGSRLWHMKYRIDGREKRLSFGA